MLSDYEMDDHDPDDGCLIADRPKETSIQLGSIRRGGWRAWVNNFGQIIDWICPACSTKERFVEIGFRQSGHGTCPFCGTQVMDYPDYNLVKDSYELSDREKHRRWKRFIDRVLE